MIICNRKQGHYSDRRTCEMMTLNEIRYNPAASTFLLVAGLALKSPHMHSKFQFARMHEFQYQFIPKSS